MVQVPSYYLVDYVHHIRKLLFNYKGDKHILTLSRSTMNEDQYNNSIHHIEIPINKIIKIFTDKNKTKILTKIKVE